MEAKDTVMSKTQRDNIFYHGIGTLEGICQMQAEISFPLGKQEGIKEVVEWGNEWCPHRDNDFPCPDHVPDELRLRKRDCPDCWQAKLKEWGV